MNGFSAARKGEHLPERPHRLARLIETPDPLELVTRAQLEALATASGANAPPTRERGVPGEGLGGRQAPGGSSRNWIAIENGGS